MTGRTQHVPGRTSGERRAVPRWRRLVGYLVFVAVLACLPALFAGIPLFTVSLAVQTALLAIAALGLVLLMGFAGQISLGQAAFFGIGAYTSAILTTTVAVSPVVALVVGTVVAGVVAWTVGHFVFRVRGHYLALATLAFGLVAAHLARQLEITGGTEGIVDIPRLAIGPVIIDSDLRYYWLAAAVLLVATILSDNLVRSHVGRTLVALGDSEPATAAAGVHIAARKRAVFVVAAVMASVAGSLYAHWVTYVDYHTLDLLLSVQLLTIAAVGGLRTVWGAAVGSLCVIILAQLAQELLPGIFPAAGGRYEVLMYGLALVLVLLFLPTGVAGGLAALGKRLASWAASMRQPARLRT